jgi:hypothetical protein
MIPLHVRVIIAGVGNLGSEVFEEFSYPGDQGGLVLDRPGEASLLVNEPEVVGKPKNLTVMGIDKVDPLSQRLHNAVNSGASTTP